MGLCSGVGRSRYRLRRSRWLILRFGRFGSRFGGIGGLRGGAPWFCGFEVVVVESRGLFLYRGEPFRGKTWGFVILELVHAMGILEIRYGILIRLDMAV